ncbi:MAG TPA: SAM-dependent methyltransferase, partial [Desulfobulbus sp.]|nr:SAM-dependent methyltransferase [Desulfobulbus sp.]
MVCGEKLQYRDQAIDLTCSYCKRADSGHIVCPNGHYICDQCHNQDAMRVIEDIILTTDSTAP